MTSQAKLLQPCATLDFVLDASADHPAAAAFAALQEGTKAAGVRAALLAPDELATQTNRCGAARRPSRWRRQHASMWRMHAGQPQLAAAVPAPTLWAPADATAHDAGVPCCWSTVCRLVNLPPGASGLLQPDGSIIIAAEVNKALQTLAERAGAAVKVRLTWPTHSTAACEPAGPTTRWLSWAVTARAACNWASARLPPAVLQERLKLRAWCDQGSHFVVSASSDLLPNSLSHFEADQLLLMPSTWQPHCLRLFGLELAGVSLRQVAGGRWAASGELQKLPLWSYLGGADSSHEPAGSTSGGGGGGGGLVLPAAAGGGASGAPCWGLPLLSDGSRLRVSQLPWQGAPVGSPFTWQQPALQLPEPPAAPAAGRGEDDGASAITPELYALHQSAHRFVRGVGSAPAVQPTCQVLAVCSDGRPVLGWHPAFEAGRMLVCAALSSSSGQQAGLAGYQLSPILAKLAADALEGSPAGDAAVAAFSLARGEVGADASGLQSLDSWEGGVAALQQAPVKSREQLEEEADAAEELRRAQERPA
jgi:hypothetical protein